MYLVIYPYIKQEDTHRQREKALQKYFTYNKALLPITIDIDAENIGNIY